MPELAAHASTGMKSPACRDACGAKSLTIWKRRTMGAQPIKIVSPSSLVAIKTKAADELSQPGILNKLPIYDWLIVRYFPLRDPNVGSYVRSNVQIVKE